MSNVVLPCEGGGFIPPIKGSPDEQAAAARTVRAHAVDDADLVLLLAVLGLDTVEAGA